MVDFSNEIINQIKEADDDTHVKILIENSIQKIHVKNINGFSAKRRLMMNMIMALRYIKAEGLSAKALENVSNTIVALEQQRKQEYSNFF